MARRRAFDVSFKQEVEVEPSETGMPYGQHLVTLHNREGKQVGNVLVGFDGKGTASVNDSGIEAGQYLPNEKSVYRGKGYGRKMYEMAIEKARELGAKRITSGGATTPDAARVWRSLAKDYKVIETKRGDQPFFIIDLRGK